jgi:hypothetical protein
MDSFSTSMLITDMKDSRLGPLDVTSYYFLEVSSGPITSIIAGRELGEREEQQKHN